MIVYRLEYKDTGFYSIPLPKSYSTEHWYNEMVEEHCSDTIHHPTAFFDFNFNTKGFHFACPSVQSFYFWFDPYWKNIERLRKARVLIYETSEFVLGNSKK